MIFGFQIPLPLLADYIFAGICFVSLAISWYYYFTYFNKVKYTAIPENVNLQPVSIIVASRNEIANLRQNIPLWLAQNYPAFELIIADDGSTDGTSDYVAELAETNSRIKLVFLDPEYVKMHGKKIALTLAFKRAMHARFLLTDADCSPASDLWLRDMASNFTQDIEIVLGYSPYSHFPGILNRMIRFETIMTALHYLGFAFKKKAYMGVGRNLAYTRQVYDRNNGFASHSHVPAGDDDLFVQQASNPKNTTVCLTPASFTNSKPKTNISEWRRQKKRHMWVGKFYASRVKNQLAPFPISQFLFITSFVIWLFAGVWVVYPLAILIIKWTPEWIIFGSRSKKLGSKDLIPWYPIFNIMHSLWYLVAGLRAFFAKKPKW